MHAGDTHPQTLDIDGFRFLAGQRLLSAPVASPTATLGASDYDLNPAADPLGPGSLIPAAVLVAVRAAEPMSVVLTERTAHLNKHAGQIAFPGGKIDPADASPLAAALREAQEEIGLDASLVEPLGYLEPYRTATGYLITPVVALVAAEFSASLDPAEVAGVFEVPFAFLLDARNHRIDSREWRGEQRQFYAMLFEQRYIWGATAGIIRMLYRRLFTP